MGSHHRADHVRTRSGQKGRGRHRAKAPHNWITPLTATAMSLSLIAPVTAHASTVLSIGATGSWTDAPVTGLQRWPYTKNFADDPVTHTEVVRYPASLGFIGLSMEESVAQGAAALYQAIQSTPGRKIITCESQGCLAVTRVLMQFTADPTTAPTDDLIIVMIGNPATAGGGASAQNSGMWEPFFRITYPGATPETDYETFNVTREYDFFADRPQTDSNTLAIWNNLVAFLVVHPFYGDVDMEDPDNLVKIVGNTTYVLIPTKQLPMLKSLYDAAEAWHLLTGSTTLLQEVESLDARIRAIIDLGYDRSGFVQQGSQTPEGVEDTTAESDLPPVTAVTDSPAGEGDPTQALLADKQIVIPQTAEPATHPDYAEEPNSLVAEKDLTTATDPEADQRKLEDKLDFEAAVEAEDKDADKDADADADALKHDATDNEEDRAQPTESTTHPGPSDTPSPSGAGTDSGSGSPEGSAQ